MFVEIKGINTIISIHAEIFSSDGLIIITATSLKMNSEFIFASKVCSQSFLIISLDKYTLTDTKIFNKRNYFQILNYSRIQLY